MSSTKMAPVSLQLKKLVLHKNLSKMFTLYEIQPLGLQKRVIEIYNLQTKRRKNY